MPSRRSTPKVPALGSAGFGVSGVKVAPLQAPAGLPQVTTDKGAGNKYLQLANLQAPKPPPTTVGGIKQAAAAQGPPSTVQTVKNASKEGLKNLVKPQPPTQTTPAPAVAANTAAQQALALQQQLQAQTQQLQAQAMFMSQLNQQAGAQAAAAQPGHQQADATAHAVGYTPSGHAQADAVGWAQTQLGVPYVFGAENPAGKAGGPGAAFDCSGLTEWVASKFGVSLPHSAAQQYDMLPHVGGKGLVPGDLVFYSYHGSGVDHVAIYIGGGQQIAAPSAGRDVLIQSVDWDNFVGGGRWLPRKG